VSLRRNLVKFFPRTGGGDHRPPAGRLPKISRNISGLPADPDELARLRRELNGWLTQFSVDSLIPQDVLIAACEACANAIEHGYRNASGGTVRLRDAGRHLVSRGT
jgi:Histidine kinase-like ATPase domain